MCLIVFAWQLMPGLPLVAASNRDEFYERPTAPANWWKDYPHVYGGRDLQKGGTWIGITREGRFAAVTHVRTAEVPSPHAPSRGKLVADYLTGNATVEEYVDAISKDAHLYPGFSLLVGDTRTLIWFSNRNNKDQRNGYPLAPGIYGLSNATLDEAWPKVVKTKAQLASLLCQNAPEEAYFEMLTDTAQAPTCKLPQNTGASLEWEKTLSAVCIDSPGYGTRTSTIVKIYADNTATLHERLIK